MATLDPANMVHAWKLLRNYPELKEAKIELADMLWRAGEYFSSKLTQSRLLLSALFYHSCDHLTFEQVGRFKNLLVELSKYLPSHSTFKAIDLYQVPIIKFQTLYDLCKIYLNNSANNSNNADYHNLSRTIGLCEGRYFRRDCEALLANPIVQNLLQQKYNSPSVVIVEQFLSECNGNSAQTLVPVLAELLVKFDQEIDRIEQEMEENNNETSPNTPAPTATSANPDVGIDESQSTKFEL
ncbi:MAG: hypothetical protein HWD59_09525 [Coxiellaceae bacterium]|nr:MAG: hypothetical protein HWD59_09525 [Coxiellaceae bacterium]